MDPHKRDHAHRFGVLAEPHEAWLRPDGGVLFAPLVPGERRRALTHVALTITTHPTHTPKKRGPRK